MDVGELDADASAAGRAASGGVTDGPGRAAPGQPGATGGITGNMDTMHLSDLLTAGQAKATTTQLLLTGANANLTLTGTGFTYDTSAHLKSGTLQTFDFQGPGGFNVTHISLNYAPGAPGAASPQIISWIFADATQTGFASLLQGDDSIVGSPTADLLRTYDGNDVLSGGGGADTLFGGAGNDSISGMASVPLGADPPSTYLRGEDGDDLISGGIGFDDINGNMGNDTAHGNAGDDWVVGGKDQDVLFGDDGGDIVWGNLGNDTLDGGAGNDQVRGGQGDDVVNGGAGNDYVSGDRGNDTITGGAGADLFHDSQDASIDRVLDFSVAEGDRVMLDPGTTYTVSQVGADTVIDFGGGNQMILVGVQMSTLPTGWIFLG